MQKWLSNNMPEEQCKHKEKPLYCLKCCPHLPKYEAIREIISEKDFERAVAAFDKLISNERAEVLEKIEKWIQENKMGKDDDIISALSLLDFLTNLKGKTI